MSVPKTNDQKPYKIRQFTEPHLSPLLIKGEGKDGSLISVF